MTKKHESTVLVIQKKKSLRKRKKRKKDRNEKEDKVKMEKRKMAENEDRLEVLMKDEKEQTGLANNIFKIANESLKQASDKKNNAKEIAMAQAMLHRPARARKEAEDTQRKIEKLVENISKGSKRPT